MDTLTNCQHTSVTEETKGEQSPWRLKETPSTEGLEQMRMATEFPANQSRNKKAGKKENGGGGWHGLWREGLKNREAASVCGLERKRTHAHRARLPCRSSYPFRLICLDDPFLLLMSVRCLPHHAFWRALASTNDRRKKKTREK